jgi:two-component system response regulator ChvI
MRVLLVDDNASLRRTMRIFLGPNGVQVEEAADGRAAIRFFEEGGYVDIVLLDFTMPRHDGLSVLPDLRAVCSVPIVLFTGSPHAIDAYWHLFDGVIDKGRPQEVLAELQRLTGAVT